MSFSLFILFFFALNFAFFPLPSSIPLHKKVAFSSFGDGQSERDGKEEGERQSVRGKKEMKMERNSEGLKERERERERGGGG